MSISLNLSQAWAAFPPEAENWFALIDFLPSNSISQSQKTISEMIFIERGWRVSFRSVIHLDINHHYEFRTRTILFDCVTAGFIIYRSIKCSSRCKISVIEQRSVAILFHHHRYRQRVDICENIEQLIEEDTTYGFFQIHQFSKSKLKINWFCSL